MQFKVAWSDLKAFATARGTPIQWIVIGSMYNIAAIDGPMEVTCVIPIKIPTPVGSDQADFETNYKSSGNGSPRSNIVQVLGKDTLTLTPFGAYSGTNLKANSISTWDVTLPQTMTLKGAEMYSPDAVLGDWCSVEVIDMANIVGAGGTPDNPTVLGVYVLSWYMAPGMWNRIEDVSISQPLPQGVTLRITYTSTGSVAPHAILNFFSYVSNS